MDKNVDSNDLQVTYLWSKDHKEIEFSDDPLEDLINEFGTEDLKEKSEIENKSLNLEDVLNEQEDLDKDYFYETKFHRNNNNQKLGDLEDLIQKTRYLSHKLKYYNDYLLNK